MHAWNFTAAAKASEAERGGKLGVNNFQELNEQRKAWKMTHRRTVRQIVGSLKNVSVWEDTDTWQAGVRCLEPNPSFPSSLQGFRVK